MIPIVALVGRPNVGKSTLFNRLMHSRKAIVQDDPGVTRDRHYGLTKLDDYPIQLVDTGGFEPDASEGIEALIREQTQIAIDEADVIVMVMDAREGLTETDKEVMRVLRRSLPIAHKPVIFVANKVESVKQEMGLGDFYRLGANEVYPVSAEHGLGIEEFIEAILEILPPRDTKADGASTPLTEGLKIALVGRPNAGKSSLLNRLVGANRSIVSKAPGTTRDPVDVQVETKHGTLTIVDTAGIRRRKTKCTTMERYAIFRAMRCIEQADIVCLVIDADEGIADQDAKMANLAIEAGRGLLIIMTKSDLLRPFEAGAKRIKQEMLDQLSFASFAPTIFVSSKTGKGISKIPQLAHRILKACGKRVTTGRLNQFLEKVVAAHSPPIYRGRPVRFYYINQPACYPPTFIISTNAAKAVHKTYRRYLVNRLREEFKFEGAPLRVFFRQRKSKAAQENE